MTDEHNDNWMQPGVYDDDRLLACALGLEDDPELLEAAAADLDLADRLAAVRADVAEIGAQVTAAVPEPDEAYADLSGERWSGLKEFFEPAAPAGHRRRGGWWAVLKPVVGLAAIALIVGIVAVGGGRLGGSSGGATSSTSGGAAPLAAAGSAQSESARDSSAKSGFSQAVGTVGEAFSRELRSFAVVVLARAREATGAVQQFAVLRTFKGEAPKVVELVVNGHPTDPGRLHLLMLNPVAGYQPSDVTPLPSASPWEGESPGPVASPASTESPVPAGGTPIPSPLAPQLADGTLGQELAVAYTYGGEPTVVRELAAGTDPSSVTIPLP